MHVTELLVTLFLNLFSYLNDRLFITNPCEILTRFSVCISFLMVGEHFPHILTPPSKSSHLSPSPSCSSKKQTAAATLHCATPHPEDSLKYFQVTCSWRCNYFRLTSIPSNLNFITGTNASSTALERKHQERKISPTDQRVTFRRQTQSIWKATPPTWHSLRKLAFAAASAGPLH